MFLPSRLSHQPAVVRVACAGFAFLVLALLALSQATLWVRDGGGTLPGPDAILGKYHGRPDHSALHDVLDLDRPAGDPRAMYWYLDADYPTEITETIRERRATILAWVEGGATRETFEPIRGILRDQARCLQCHGLGGEKQDLPLETFEEVSALARPGQGMALASLLVSAHNHILAFGMTALLLALATAGTLLSGRAKALLAGLAFAGAAIDVGGWFFTRAFGSPWQYAVLLGGAAFGLATGLMATLVLDETLWGGWFTRRLLRRPAGGAEPGPGREDAGAVR